KSILRESRLSLTTQLVEFINQYQQYPVFISGSATGIYGDQGEQKITETSKTAKTFTAQLCQDWENIARQANARVCLIRTGIVFSKKGGALAKMLPLYKWGLGGNLGKGEQYFPWIALEDIVNGILFLLDHSECRGAFNFAAPKSIKQHKFNRTLARILKRPAFATIPKWLLHFILGERANLLLESQNVVPEKLLNAGFQFQYSDCKNYLEEILKNK
ncbi:TIGR01777 family oxidoreductase, partial [Haemophilus influenzae]